MKNPQTNRRKFLRNTGTVMTGIGLSTLLPLEAIAAMRKSVAPSDKIKVALVGCNGMGWTNLRSHLKIDNIDCIALCDVDQNVLDKRSAELKKAIGKAPKQYKDYRKLLENKELDVVIIATPDHWHCKMMVDAISAGKHVYVEKPLANSIEECKVMLTAAKRYNQLVQVGQWQRSGTHYEQAIDLVRSGKLGNIRLVKVWAYQGWMQPVAIKADSKAPAGVDYKMWLGPAKDRPFNENRFHFSFRWFWDYAGGMMTDWGVHEIDIALYAMNAKAPKSVMASGGKLAYPDDASETPDTLQAVFEYDNFNMLWEHATGIDNGNYGKSEGIAFIGNHGTLVLNRGGWEIIPETMHKDGMRYYEIEAIPHQSNKGDYLDMHTRNFVDAIQKNDPSILNCGVETGSIAAINAHMGNVAYKTGRKVYWDENAGLFKKDKEANQLIKAQYHNGWTLPNV